MSALHPIVSVTGSSGSGTTSVRNTFDQIFRREGVEAAFIEGDAFHAFDRAAMREAMAREPTLSHFGERANLLAELEAVFHEYGATGRGRTRHYVHDAEDAARFGAEPGTFTPWEDFTEGSDLLFYEGLHGALVTDTLDIAAHADLKIGVVPVINLEWIQKLHRDKAARGYSIEAVTDVILRRMPDYVTTICPQFTNTDINFQRIPTVDTSNPFVARWIPTADESMVVIRFRDPKGIDFPYLISMIAGSFMSRANSVVIPGGKLDLAMQLILTPMILRLVERRRRLL
ncbi:phosphoribulokinase [Methylobacterium tarhaniae]|uniref:Phosphoribulokinase n=1 Tax=Methylobacterium tarhaniae TaxID=1187852 RepID=A0A0J6SSX2_9HYPH|nr:phosphoribulokinase [Methylobacterium tarhaniae]KMO38355.1 phosphoribulokinase [Methylobacterium tarhaniae]